MHYRLGYQLLAENPELFFATICPSENQLHLEPIAYGGGELKYSSQSAGWHRIAKALLPFLERLATSHGKLLDGEVESTNSDLAIRKIPPGNILLPHNSDSKGSFEGFSPEEGWGPEEGPVPEAFLPSFHWGHYPQTQLVIDSVEDQTVILNTEFLTYSENQSMNLRLNGIALESLTFPQINQKESLCIPLHLRAGRNELTFQYSEKLVTDYDERQLAVLFLTLRITSSGSILG